MITDPTQEPGLNIGEMVLHHAADAWTIPIDLPFFHHTIHLARWPDVHIGSMTLNFSPTKHVYFMLLAALLVFLMMWIAGRQLQKTRQTGQHPRGFGGAVEAAVLWVRNEVVLPNIPHGERFAPLIVALFFFVLFCNLLGLIPNGASPTGNLAVTGALAILVFLVIEIGGMIKLGPKGYLGTIFPHVEGLPPAGALAMSIGMAPIEVIGKLVKPFALAVRLFGNMTAGHFVILSLFGIIFIFGKISGLNWGVGIAMTALVTAMMALELFVAFLQAYVFALLTAVFIGLMQEEHH
jgi:F-type H+-transporting ATPase subunit a